MKRRKKNKVVKQVTGLTKTGVTLTTGSLIVSKGVAIVSKGVAKAPAAAGAGKALGMVGGYLPITTTIGMGGTVLGGVKNLQRAAQTKKRRRKKRYN